MSYNGLRNKKKQPFSHRFFQRLIEQNCSISFKDIMDRLLLKIYIFKTFLLKIMYNEEQDFFINLDGIIQLKNAH